MCNVAAGCGASPVGVIRVCVCVLSSSILFKVSEFQ